MPLHTDGETRSWAGGGGKHLNRFDGAIRGDALDPQPRSELVHTLVMQGVHRDFRGAGKPVQPAAGGNPNGVCLADPHLTRGDSGEE